MATTTAFPSLVSFFIYSLKHGLKERNEHEKVFFYYPSDASLDTKMTNVGLSEGLVQFTKMFVDGSVDPCQHVLTDKLIRVFYEAEPDFWLSLVATNEAVSKKNKDGSIETSYVENGELGRALRGVLHMAYSMFRLFHGKFEQVIEKQSADRLREKLEKFMPQYIKSVDTQHLDITRTYHGIHFLPVDKNAYLRVQSFVSLVESNFKIVKNCVFLYRNLLVWSGLELEDMRIMYNYLTNMLGSIPGKANEKTGFLTGPMAPGADAPPSVYLGNERDEVCDAVIFRSSDVMIVLMIDTSNPAYESEKDKMAFYQRLNDVLVPETSVLSNLIGQQYSILSGRKDDPFKYLYFNRMNLAMKTSLPDDGVTLPDDLQRILTWMSGEFERGELRPRGGPAELCVKTSDEGWVVGRRSDAREFYVLFDSQNANLIEIHEDVQNLVSTYFSNIFIA